MALAESQCYTIINTSEPSDLYNEMKLKKDLGQSSELPIGCESESKIIDR